MSAVALPDAAFVLGAYLVGSFRTAQLVGARRGFDPTRRGSGNPGASNVYRIGGWRAGVLVAAGDVLKGVVPVALALAFDSRELAMWCWVAAVLGHVVPITRALRGGKGVATAAGGTVVLFPAVALVLAAMFFTVVNVTRIASVASLVTAVALPVLVGVTGRPGREVLLAAAVSALVVVRHSGNIRRLARREEHVFR